MSHRSEAMVYIYKKKKSDKMEDQYEHPYWWNWITAKYGSKSL